MAYRNKTFISFASEDIGSYRIMQMWNKNENIDFNFYDAHDLNTALDTSLPETIKRRLRERLSNAKQIIVLVGDVTKSKAARESSFIHYEIEVIKDLDIPVIFANLNKSRDVQSHRIPTALGSPLYSISVSFQAKIIKYALDEFPDSYNSNTTKVGPHQYKPHVYESLGL